MQRQRDIGIFLLEAPGAGKRMLGNLIIGRPVFLNTSVPQSATAANNLNIHHAIQQNRAIAVAEGPDIGTPQQRADNSRALVQSLNTFIAVMDQRQCYFEFALVLHIGDRITEDFQSMILFLEAVLGPVLLTNHTRIVMNGGDIFEREFGNNLQETFLAWCVSQTQSFLKDLMTRCQWRVHLLGSSRRDEADIQKQVQDFINSVDYERQDPENRGSQRYQYRQAINSRTYAIVSSRKNLVEQSTEGTLGPILRQLNQVRTRVTPLEQLPTLERLRSDTQQIFNEVREEDCGTGVLERALTQAELANRSVIDAIAVCKNLIQSDNRSSVCEGRISQLYMRQARIIMVMIVMVGIVFIQNFGLPYVSSPSDSHRTHGDNIPVAENNSSLVTPSVRGQGWLSNTICPVVKDGLVTLPVQWSRMDHPEAHFLHSQLRKPLPESQRSVLGLRAPSIRNMHSSSVRLPVSLVGTTGMMGTPYCGVISAWAGPYKYVTMKPVGNHR
ncbi:hypothetical protein RRG08_060876 [Elysia crispata]|uniref:AIG1-type G domain-containing protein n=1 Tax=Elysia crispata TaxID=231223 RepID=A0AAE0ZFN0_9GAST|nr:hypothetical protein RRG08_060876 [Elysia crispata]